jgi:hypothetical protein
LPKDILSNSTNFLGAMDNHVAKIISYLCFT